jgi:ribonuclease D
VAQLSELLSIPVENLMTPELVRRACWCEPLDSEAAYNELLEAGGARKWQRELILPIVYAARKAQPLPAEDPEPETQ